MIEKTLKYSFIRIVIKALIGLTIILFAYASNAQTIEIGGFGGTSYYLGELNPALPYNQTQLAYGALARYNINPRWAAKFSYYRGNVQGSDATGGSVINRDLNFKSKINDFSLVAEFNFWEYFTGSKKNFFTPFIFGGISFFTFKPTSSSGVALQPIGTEGQNIGFANRNPYNLYSVAFPFGFGFKYSISERFGLTFEWGMRKTLTDYIDDVSTTYYLTGSNINPDYPAEILSDPSMTHDPFMQRGDDQTKDWYNYTGITVTYKFDLQNNKRCNNVEWK
ncbi:MAG: hypothetical protein H8E34_07430 [Bacteroidetes bacterium]|nr:hypothetical protein [Bacteroidota bacterium]MBL6943571.1 hypothetical protein [Bacteroidales bacterium]